MALRSNFKELPQISQFCRERTKDYFRFDPLLNLRLDRDPAKNEEIKSERLTPQEIVAIETADSERFSSLEKGCDKLINPEFANVTSNRLFHCGTGNGSFVIGFDGNLRLCMYSTTTSALLPPAVDTEHPNFPVSIWQWIASESRSKKAFIGAGTELI